MRDGNQSARCRTLTTAGRGNTEPIPRVSAALGTVVVAIALAGCAHVEAPPGGPPDETPPSVASTIPENEAVLESFEGPVVFVFDERISERDVEEAVIVSPRTSPVVVTSSRTGLRVSLRNGWEPNVIYQITLRPQIRDLFSNPIAEAYQLVFSTGPPIPDTRLTGTVLDRITGRPEADFRVEAIRSADSLVYAVATSREGQFEISRIPEGDYEVRAFEDVNRNRALDIYEARDSASAAVIGGDPLEFSFRVLLPDSTPPTIASVTARARTIEIEFDDYLDPAQTIDPGQVTIVHPSDGPVQIGRVALGQLTAPDTAGVGAAAPSDTVAAAAAPTPAGPDATPSQTLAVELIEGVELAPGVEYAVTVQEIRNLNGLVGDAEATLEAEAADADP